MIFGGQVGPDILGDGTEAAPRLDRTGALVIQQLGGRYGEATFRGTTFSAANQAAQAVSVALATTYTGILLYNPVGSLVNLELLKAKFALSVAPAAIAPIGLISGFSGTGGVTAQTSLLIPKSNFIGSPGGSGLALSQATIVTPTWHFQLYDGFTAAALPPPTMPVDLEGLIYIPPGGFVGIGALTAVTGLGSLTWREIPRAI